MVHKDEKLNLRFRSYSPICVPRRGNAIDMGLPFRHLASDGLYVHVGEGERTVKLEPGLLATMRVPAWCQEARRRVVATCFPPDEQVALCSALQMPLSTSDELAEVREDVLAYKTQLSRGRDARFKLSVISGYHFTCALTGYRLIAAKSNYAPLEVAYINNFVRKETDGAVNSLP